VLGRSLRFAYFGSLNKNASFHDFDGFGIDKFLCKNEQSVDSKPQWSQLTKGMKKASKCKSAYFEEIQMLL
jgi:hypothetical protein